MGIQFKIGVLLFKRFSSNTAFCTAQSFSLNSEIKHKEYNFSFLILEKRAGDGRGEKVQVDERDLVSS